MPAGLKDFTQRWVKIFAAVFEMDWLEFLSRFFKVTVGGPGSISRLHCHNNGAHEWYSQIQGRRLFVMFSPQDVARGCLYEDAGGRVEGALDFVAACSPVDIFFPSERRHPKFAQAKPHVVVVRPGDTLVIPAGWWHYSVALEASVTLHHPFWNLHNRKRIADEFNENFDQSRMPPELQAQAARNLQQIREKIADDDDSDMDE